jgi:hypothetical protein
MATHIRWVFCRWGIVTVAVIHRSSRRVYVSVSFESCTSYHVSNKHEGGKIRQPSRHDKNIKSGNGRGLWNEKRITQMLVAGEGIVS